MTKQDPLHPTPYIMNIMGIEKLDYLSGITKREYIATKVLCSLISYPHDSNIPNEPNIKGDIKFAVQIADWLLEELNE